jgi:glycosyltransferase involved in cell wall biosynthesis
MRILLLTPLYPPEIGGAATYFGLLAEGLAARAEVERVWVVTARRRGARLLEHGGRLTIVRALTRRMGQPRRSWIGWIDQMVLLCAVALLVRLRGIHVLHYHTQVSQRGLRWLAPLLSSRIVGDMRDLAARDEGSGPDAYAHCDRIIAASENVAQWLSQIGIPGHKIRHIPFPFPPPRPQPPESVARAQGAHGLTPGIPYLCFVGNLTARKGVRELLDAFRELEDPDLRLVLIGPNRGVEDAVDLTSQVARVPRVHYLGALPHAETMALLQGAEAMVLPSRSEANSRVALEAIALGIKVVLPPGVPEYRHACPDFVLADLTVQGLVRKIREVRASPNLPTYPFERHHPDAAITSTLAVYREIATAPRSRAAL